MKQKFYNHFIYLFFLAIICTIGVLSPAYAQPSDNTLLNAMQVGNMPGATFGVVKNDKLVYQKNLGYANLSANRPVDNQTVFMLASVSKTMIATAVMQLWEKQQLELDVDINRYLPFSVRTPAFPNDSITARMLLTHTSAIQDNWLLMASLYTNGDSPIPLDALMSGYFTPGGNYYSTNNFHSFKPGTQSDYSNMGSTLAAYLVEAITGDKFSHYCDTAIFQKLCMSSTSYLLSGYKDNTVIARPYVWESGQYWDMGLYGYPDYPDGQLRSTGADMARFMSMYLQSGIYDGVRILDSTTVAYILSPQSPVDPAQGIIFYSVTASNGDQLWGHNGGDSGVNTAMYFNPAKKTGALAFTNGDGNESVFADIFVNTYYNYGLTVSSNAPDLLPACNNPMSKYVDESTHYVHVYPNPSPGLFYVVSHVAGEAIVYDIQGKICFKQSIAPGRNEVMLGDHQPAGVYYISVFYPQSLAPVTKKLVLMR